MCSMCCGESGVTDRGGKDESKVWPIMELDKTDEGRVLSVARFWVVTLLHSPHGGQSNLWVAVASVDALKWWRREISMSSDLPSILTILPEIFTYICTMGFYSYCFVVVFASQLPPTKVGRTSKSSHCGVFRLQVERAQERDLGSTRELKGPMPS